MTSINQTSSGNKANPVSSSPELLTRPASKPDDRSNSSTGELCTSGMSRRRDDESHFLSARANREYPNHFLIANRTEVHFTTLQAVRRSGCSACSAYPVKKIRNTSQPLALSLSARSRSCLISSPGGEDQDEGVLSFDSRQTLDFPTQNAFLKLNTAAIFSLQPLARSLSAHSRPARTFLLSIVHERPDFLKDYEIFYFRFNSPSAETTAETALRFAETSQQTLRHISLLPTTYIDFAEKNALKSKLLRLLRLDPNVNSRSCLISSPIARAARTEDQDEGVRSFDPRRTLDFPTQNAFLKLNLASLFSVSPSTLNPEIPQPIPCVATSLILGARAALSAASHPFVTAKKHGGPDKNTRKNTRSNTLKCPKNTQNRKKNTFFFCERRNVDLTRQTRFPCAAISLCRYVAAFLNSTFESV
jgi:hypothetical protein